MRGFAACCLCAVTGLSCMPVAHSQPLNLQAMCATQAKKAFQEWLGDNKSQGPELISGDYSSHYNTTLGKCLMQIEATHSSNKQVSSSKLLMDAFERRVYASYLWISKEGKPFWGEEPEKCELNPSLRQTKNCNSEEEFKAFVADYMEE
jgi:hypothetical protein